MESLTFSQEIIPISRRILTVNNHSHYSKYFARSLIILKIANLYAMLTCPDIVDYKHFDNFANDKFIVIKIFGLKKKKKKNDFRLILRNAEFRIYLVEKHS